MQSTNKPWLDLRTELEICLADSQLTTAELAKKAGLNYHAVRRLRLAGVKNQTENTSRLCIFFGITAKRPRPADVRQELAAAIAAVTSGTTVEAGLLLEIATLLSRFDIRPKPVGTAALKRRKVTR